MSLVRFSRQGRVGVIAFNNPKALNALTVDMGNEFRSLIEDLRINSEDLGAVVLTGEGRAFSAGGDLQFLRDRHKDTPSRNSVIMREFYSRFLSIRNLPVPTIAAINGHAIGAGLCVSLACDLRIANKDARLGVTFAGLGIHPGMGASYFLPRLVGQQQAAKLMLTGEPISGVEAEKIGMVLEAVPEDEVLPRSLALAEKIASKSPIAVRSCARTIRMNQDEGLDRALWREADAQSYCYASKDLHEGVEATANKRAPEFNQFEGYNEKLE